MDTHQPEAGGLVTNMADEVRAARDELRASAKEQARERMDDLLDRIRDARNAAPRGSFERAEYRVLLDRALEARRRFFSPHVGQ